MEKLIEEYHEDKALHYAVLSNTIIYGKKLSDVTALFKKLKINRSFKTDFDNRPHIEIYVGRMKDIYEAFIVLSDVSSNRLLTEIFPERLNNEHYLNNLKNHIEI